MSIFLALLKKEFSVESRSQSFLALLVTIPVLLSAILSFALQSSMLNQDTTQRLYPALVWIIFLFSITLLVEKIWDSELHSSAWLGLLCSGLPASTLYLTKVSSAFVASFLSFLISSGALAIFLSVQLSAFSFDWILIGLCTALAYSSLAVLVSALTATSKLKGILLPAVLLPLLCPVLFAGVELSNMTWSGTDGIYSSTWFSMLTGLAILYPTIGVILFEKVLTD